MLSFPVFAKLQPGLLPSSRCRRLPRDPLSLLFATHTDPRSCKSFSCHSYKNMGGVYELFPLWNSPLGRPPWRAIRPKPLCAPRAQIERTNCALFRNNSFPCHTCLLHGGEGGTPLSSSLPPCFTSLPCPCSRRGLS